MAEKWRLYAFDFDGTLVDNYSSLPNVWKKIGESLGLKKKDLELFVKYALGENDIGKWTRNALAKIGRKNLILMKNCNNSLLENRVSRTIILPCAKEILEKLKIKAISLPAYHAPMGIRSMKRRRIVHSGLSLYFNDIIVAGEDVSSKSEAMDVLARKYNYSRKSCVLIDDKPVPINEVSMSGFSTIKIDST